VVRTCGKECQKKITVNEVFIRIPQKEKGILESEERGG
jgi:hypothetical protein